MTSKNKREEPTNMTDHKPLTKEEVDFINKKEPSTAFFFEYKIRSAYEGMRSGIISSGKYPCEKCGMRALSPKIEFERTLYCLNCWYEKWFPVFKEQEEATR